MYSTSNISIKRRLQVFLPGKLIHLRLVVLLVVPTETEVHETCWMLTTSVPKLLLFTDLAFKPVLLTVNYLGICTFQAQLGSDTNISSFLHCHGLELGTARDKVTSMAFIQVTCLAISLQDTTHPALFMPLCLGKVNQSRGFPILLRFDRFLRIFFCVLERLGVNHGLSICSNLYNMLEVIK